jgi:hypothetical protein
MESVLSAHWNSLLLIGTYWSERDYDELWQQTGRWPAFGLEIAQLFAFSHSPLSSGALDVYCAFTLGYEI